METPTTGPPRGSVAVGRAAVGHFRQAPRCCWSGTTFGGRATVWMTQHSSASAGNQCQGPAGCPADSAVRPRLRAASRPGTAP